MSIICKHGQLARSCYICELEQEIKELKKSNEYWPKKRTPDNPRYMLWMLYKGILEPPEEQYEYINWLHDRIRDFNAQREKGIKDMDKYLMWYVRNHLIANCSVSETF